MHDETELIVRCQKGDSEAFGQLYDLYIKKIYDFLYFRTFHKETAEDLTDTVFTKAFERIKQYNEAKGKFSTWLYQIAKNTLTDYFRTMKTAENIEDIWDLSSGANLEKDADAVLLLEKVQARLKQLPSMQRDIVVMRVWDGLSHKEIADLLDITEGNSKVSFARAVEKLKSEISLALLMIIVLSHFKF